MKTKKVMATVLSAVTALSMAGGMATTVKADDVTEITFPTSWVGVSVNTEWFQDRLEAFNEEYGDSIKVNVEEIAGDQNYVDKLKVLYSSNSLPDTFSTGGYNLIDSMKDQLVDLTDYVDDDWKKLATDACWDVNSRDGKIYGIPYTRQVIDTSTTKISLLRQELRNRQRHGTSSLSSVTSFWMQALHRFPWILQIPVG